MESNIAELCGIVMSELEFSHKTYGEVFYTFVLGVQRRSGYVDELNVMVSERLIYDNPPRRNQFLEISDIMKTIFIWRAFCAKSPFAVPLLWVVTSVI